MCEKIPPPSPSSAPHAAHALESRRNLLHTAANPERGIEYLCLLRARLPAEKGRGTVESQEGTEVSLRYVPDKHILLPEGFSIYLPIINAACGETLEHLATSLLSDATNVLLPQWIEVVLRRIEQRETALSVVHAVALEDRRPGWSNRTLETHSRL